MRNKKEIHFRDALHHASLVLDMVRKLVTKMLNHGAYGHGGRVTQRTDGAPLNIVSNVVEQIEIFHSPLAGFNPVHHTVKPACAFAAGCALAAGFLEIEI